MTQTKTTKAHKTKTSTKKSAVDTLRVSILRTQKEWIVAQSKVQQLTQAEFVQNMIQTAQNRQSHSDLPELIKETIREEIKKLQKTLQQNVLEGFQKVFNRNVDEVVESVHDVVDGVNEAMNKGKGFVLKVAEKAKAKSH